MQKIQRLTLYKEPQNPDRWQIYLESIGWQVDFNPLYKTRYLTKELSAILAQPKMYDGLLVTSQNAVYAISQCQIHPSWLDRVFVVGPATASALNRLGFTCLGEHTGNAQALKEWLMAEYPFLKLLHLVGDKAKLLTYPTLLVYETQFDPDAQIPPLNPVGLFFSPSGVEWMKEHLPKFCIAVGPTTQQALEQYTRSLVCPQPRPEALDSVLRQLDAIL